MDASSSNTAKIRPQPPNGGFSTATIQSEPTGGNFALGIQGFEYADLFSPPRLADLYDAFLRFLDERDPALGASYRALRAAVAASPSPTAETNASRHEESKVLVEVAKHQSAFIAKLFDIEEAREASRRAHERETIVSRYKRDLVLRRALKRYAESDPVAAPDLFAPDGLLLRLRPDLAVERETDPEYLVAALACQLMDLEAAWRRIAAAASHPPSPVPPSPAAYPNTVAVPTSPAAYPNTVAVPPSPAAYPNTVAVPTSPGASPDAEPVVASPDAPPEAAPVAAGAASLDTQPVATAPPGHGPTAATASLRAAMSLSETALPSENLAWLEDLLEAICQWSAAAFHQREHPRDGQRPYADWVSLQPPEDLHWPDGLVGHQRPRSDLPNAIEGPPGTRRLREGFKLTDRGHPLRYVIDQAHYCVICHERQKDSCSLGYPLPRRDKPVARNPLGVTLNGCPLDERISEMHVLKRQGDTIASLAMVMVDNPMCPTTGHRICNDCMKGCVYQKQSPVDIPQNETRSLIDTLRLPWGVEIYGLLTRWNPINVRRPYALPYNGKNVLIVGLGPAGFSLAQYLLNEGFGVVGVDGLKIEPLPTAWTGTDEALPEPIRNYATIEDELDRRVPAGFGGVAEYGITVRWDKNFLKLIHLTLRRRPTFRAYGGIRFGGTLTAEDAWDLGFHHVSLAAGAGKPTIVSMKNNMITGVRMASDFLMALQLTGAGKETSLANLQIRLPVVVIGGGLTAIDTATEALAYYPIQVMKFTDRYERLAAETGEETILKAYNDEEKQIASEFLEHGRILRAEREQARAERRVPDYVSWIRQWGGVSLAYRRRMQDSPAYRLNHEEIAKAFEEGITYLELLEPRECLADAFGTLRAARFEKLVELEPGKWTPGGETIDLPARTLLVAAGTSPNTIYERELPGRLQLDDRRRYFKGFNVEDGKLVPAAQTMNDPGFFTSYERDGHFVSYFGDNHPVYAGSVVKAVASGKYGSRAVAGLFAGETATLAPSGQAQRDASWRRFSSNLEVQWLATVERVERLTPTIVEVVVRAPLQARHFQPGQFYRLQDFESRAPMLEGSRLCMEGIALTGAWVDRAQGLLSMIALELGVSSRLCAFLRPGDRVIAMGPTGTPSEIGREENVVLCGGGLGNAVLFSIARAMKANGCRVVYFAGYRKPEDVFHRDKIEEPCDQVIWSVDSGEPIAARRPQDRNFVGNIVQSMLAWAKGEMGEQAFPMQAAHRILAIGSDRMMAAVKAARTDGVLKQYFCPGHEAIASINSPMQCMMKEICAQCLQRQVDPETGRETFVFSCFQQDQRMDFVDFENLNLRLKQNTVLEKISSLWLDLLVRKHELPRA